MTETIVKHENIELKCFVCSREMQQGDLAFCLFSERYKPDGTQDTAISEVLSSILSLEILEDGSQSKIICEKCNSRLNKYEELEQQMLEIKYKIIQDFSVTSRLDNGEMQFEIEESFDMAIEEQFEQQADNDPKDLQPDPEQIANNAETSNADLLSLLSNHKGVSESMEDRSVARNNVVIKEENLESEHEEEAYFDPSTGNMVEIMTDGNVDYDQLMDGGTTVQNSIIPNSRSSPNESNVECSEDDNLDTRSFVFFNGLKYMCLICSSESSEEEQTSEYDDVDSVLKHLKDVHDVVAFICEICGEDFTKQENLSQHVQEKHDQSGKDNFNAKVVEERTPYYTFNGENFSCLLCPPDSDAAKTKCVARTMSAHFKAVHNLRVYICDICGIDFKKRMEVTEHVDEVHGGTDDGEFICDTCQRVFTNLRQFRIHKRLHYTSTKSYQCSQCDKKYSSKNLLDEHMNMHTGLRPYKCPICTKDFASKYTLTAHMKIHSERPRPFTCKQCGKAFFSAQNLLQHEKIHTGLKEFVCEVCNKAFGTQHNLEVHKIIHTGYKPFICRTCGKAFARRAEIRDHERTHTGERPFVCDICNMSFAQRSNLTTHKRATHLNDKRYKCEQCDRSFKRRRLLDYHIRASHTGERPYVCVLCNATFVYPEHYKKHLRIHSGVKPYSCEVCGKSFNSRDNRNAHRFIHSDKKPYECLVCGQGFMRKPLLYTHMQQSGHVNDTIIINQPRIMSEPESKKGADENVLIEMVKDELVEEQLIDGPSQYATSADEEIDGVIDDDNSISNEMLEVDLTEVMNTDQFVVRYEGDSEAMQLVQIRTKDETGKDAFAWVNLVSEKDS